MRCFSVFFATFATAKAGRWARQGMTPAHSCGLLPLVKGFGIFDMFAFAVFMCVQFARFGGFSYYVFFVRFHYLAFLYYDYKRFFEVFTRYPGRAQA